MLDACVVERHEHNPPGQARLFRAERSVADAAHELKVALGSLAREPLGNRDGEDRTIDLGEVPKVANHVLT